MCELFGFSAREPERLNDSLREFFSHSSKHPHGWGMMYSSGIIKSAERASDSPTAAELCSSLPPQRVMLAHIRYATVGSIRQENCHPYSEKDQKGRRWTLIHNGTIYSGHRLMPYMSRQTGDTDSERLFMYLMDRVNGELDRGSEMSFDERFSLIEDMVTLLSPRNKLNLMIYDGEYLYVHKNMRSTMSYRKTERGLLFSTQPLDDSHWEDVPIARLIACKNGRIVRQSSPHGGIFVPTLQYIKAMDAMNI